MKRKALFVFLLTLFVQGSAIASGYTWEYRDWKTEVLNSDKYRYITNGQVVYGNQFGFWVDKGNCSRSVLWLTISTYEKGLSEYQGEDVKLIVKVDDKESLITVPLVTAFKFTSKMDIANFTNLPVTDEFINDLKKGDSVSFTVNSPSEIARKFDIKTETFSLSGFSANYLKAIEACKKGDGELVIAPSISKEEIQQEKFSEYLDKVEIAKVELRNTSPDAAECDSLFKTENIDLFRELIKEWSLKYTIKDFFMFSGVGSDGWDQYPNIEVSNICNFSKKLPVTEILKSDQQIFQMEIQGNRLYVMANYDSREYAKYDSDIRDRAVLQIIDIENIENIKILGETIIEGLVPRFTADERYAYIANSDDIAILDVSNPENIMVKDNVELTFNDVSSDDIAVIGSHIFVTGNNVLKVIDRESTKLTQELEFDFRTSDIVVHNKHIYILGWRNDWRNSKIAILELNQGQAKLRSIVETSERIYEFKLIDRYLVGRQGKELFYIAKDGELYQYEN